MIGSSRESIVSNRMSLTTKLRSFSTVGILYSFQTFTERNSLGTSLEITIATKSKEIDYRRNDNLAHSLDVSIPKRHCFESK